MGISIMQIVTAAFKQFEDTNDPQYSTLDITEISVHNAECTKVNDEYVQNLIPAILYYT